MIITTQCYSQEKIMRQVIDDFIYSSQDTVLLVADLGKFPKTKNTDKYVNVGVAETLLVNVALGIALTGKHVYVYSAVNFVLYKAFEQIKINVLGNSSCDVNCLNITFLNGGAGFCYAGCGIGHYLLDDIHIAMTCFNGMNCYFPYDKNSTLKALNMSMHGINYIRLCMDNQTSEVQLKKYDNAINIAVFGWLVETVNNICQKNNICANIVPIFTLDQLKELNDYILIYDNVFTPALQSDSCIAAYYFKMPYDCIGENRLQTLKKYKFDDDGLLKFIRQYA